MTAPDAPTDTDTNTNTDATLGDFAGDSPAGTDTVDAADWPDGACARYDLCGTILPDSSGMCGSCLDEVRATDREADYEQYPDYLADKPGVFTV